MFVTIQHYILLLEEQTFPEYVFIIITGKTGNLDHDTSVSIVALRLERGGGQHYSTKLCVFLDYAAIYKHI